MRILRGHTDGVLAVAYAPDGKTLATGGSDRTVRLWDTVSGQEVGQLRGHRGGVYAVGFSPGGKILASGGGNMALKLWDLASGKCVANLSGHTAVVKCLAFTADGRYLFSGGGDRSLSTHRAGQAIRWDLADGNRPQQFWTASHGVLAVAVAPDGKAVAVGTGNKEIVVLEPGPLGPARVLRQPSAARGLAFTPDGRTLVSVASRRLRLWDVASGKASGWLEGHADRVNALAAVPGLGLLASGSWDDTVRLWDVAARRQRAAYDWKAGKISGLAFAPDGMTAAAACGDGSVVVWDVDAG